MNDILPADAPWWQKIERATMTLAQRYGYHQIRFPMIEKTELFKRSVGEVTDIVQKEMYTFDARNGESLSLRPEGTAGCVRAVLQHGLSHQNQAQRLWYCGPMYRHERPQKGRYRQFHQFSLEAFGMSGALIEAEQIAFCWRLFGELGLRDKVELEVNSLGTSACRQRYREALVAYLIEREAYLDKDSKLRLESNPLRILDSKNSDTQTLLNDAPKLKDYLSDESKAHFDQLVSLLDNMAIPFTVNDRLVRGLDYYSHTVYEWKTTDLGAQGTICAGGRYDSLVTLLGGRPTGAVGFAVGLERLILLLQTLDGSCDVDNSNHAYLIAVGEQAQAQQRVTHNIIRTKQSRQK